MNRRRTIIIPLVALTVVFPMALHAQSEYRADFYGFAGHSVVAWQPIAQGDSVGIVTYVGHEAPTTGAWPPVAYTCTETWYQRSDGTVGLIPAGICTAVDDDGDAYQFFFQGTEENWGEGAQGTWSCIRGTGKYEGVRCEGRYRSSQMGSGWFQGVKEGTIVGK